MDMQTMVVAVLACLILILILVALLLILKAKLTPSGTVSIDINNGKKVVDVPQGGSLLATLAEQKVFLPSACGGKGSCGQCKCRVLEGAEASSPPRPCTFRASR